MSHKRFIDDDKHLPILAGIITVAIMVTILYVVDFEALHKSILTHFKQEHINAEKNLRINVEAAKQSVGDSIYTVQDRRHNCYSVYDNVDHFGDVIHTITTIDCAKTDYFTIDSEH